MGSLGRQGGKGAVYREERIIYGTQRDTEGGKSIGNQVNRLVHIFVNEQSYVEKMRGGVTVVSTLKEISEQSSSSIWSGLCSL